MVKSFLRLNLNSNMIILKVTLITITKKMLLYLNSNMIILKVVVNSSSPVSQVIFKFQYDNT